MGCLFSKCISSSEEPKIKIIDCTPPGAAFNYLRPKGTISFSVDRKYNIPVVDISLKDGMKTMCVFFPCHTEHREHFLQLQRTPLQTPSVSSEDSGYDTVF